MGEIVGLYFEFHVYFNWLHSRDKVKGEILNSIQHESLKNWVFLPI